MTFEQWWNDHGKHNAAAKGGADRGVKELMRLAFDVGQEKKGDAVAAERERWIAACCTAYAGAMSRSGRERTAAADAVMAIRRACGA